MNWEEVKEIRKNYPRRLTAAHMQEIMEKWGMNDPSFRTDRSDMFYFACTPRKDGKMNLSELKFWFIVNNKFHELKIREYNDVQYSSPGLQKMHGCLFAAYFGHIIDGGEYEKSTQRLRISMLKSLLKIWKKTTIYFDGQLKGVQEVIDIKANVRKNMIERYPDSKKHFDLKSFENQCWEIIKNFVYENSTHDMCVTGHSSQ